jgi:hypothetical protein
MESNHPSVGLPRPAGFEDLVCGVRPAGVPVRASARGRVHKRTARRLEQRQRHDPAR